MAKTSLQKKIIKKQLVNHLKRKYPKTHTKSKKQLDSHLDSLAHNTIKNIEKWLSYEIPYEYKNSVLNAIYKENWSNILDAFSDEISFGNSSIRGKMTSSSKISKPMINSDSFYPKTSLPNNLQGTNTINPITLLHLASGISNYCKKHGLEKIIIGFDNRLQSKSFAGLLVNYFLESNFSVKIFDNICSTPELAFSVKKLHLDLGIIITASHNDKRFSGLKIVDKLGGPLNQIQINQIIRDINTTKKNPPNLINFFERNHSENSNLEIISRHKISKQYVDHLSKFLSKNKNMKKNTSKLKIGFSATQGTGYYIASKLFTKLGIKNVRYIDNMINPNALFELFDTTQTLEPGDKIIYEKTINEFINQYGKYELENLDAILFTDPDSDRIGMICKVSSEEHKLFGKYKFLTGNEMWTVILWYILEKLNKNNNLLSKKNNLFIVKSFITSDSLKSLSKKFNVNCFDGNVGFPALTNLVKNKWKKNMINVSMFEESNGFSIAGHPTINSNILPHTLEKDGFLGIVKIIETLTYAKSHNRTFYQILNEIYQMHDIGYYHNFRAQIPEKDSFEHMTDNIKKNQILINIKKFTDRAETQSSSKNPIQLGGLSISKVKKFNSVKKPNFRNNFFPFEGIRFYFNSIDNHLTIRSSNTESKIRLFIQLRIPEKNNDLLHNKIYSQKISQKIISDIKKIIL